MTKKLFNYHHALCLASYSTVCQQSMKNRKQLFRRYRNSKIEQFKFELTFCMAVKIQKKNTTIFGNSNRFIGFFFNYDFQKKPKVFSQFKEKRNIRLHQPALLIFMTPFIQFPLPRCELHCICTKRFD